ncbi:LysR family transcriptional regulator [Pseudomonas umsongensis]|jgi:DNA-binding transcriptional LysR family regulator|uniref:LysR family transcriptional regulator n=1 Tax=Pseudomonas TaxID=286 RepID=UPI0003431CA8|nr:MULTISPECIES: LysR family transcriptional regulator [Pseudomonas]EPA99113.1 transcriptional regulator [Pseudomonas sp. G5(2012)]MBT9571423.1 LysR family transcriptional regulator [Pseudomonas umsongensis]QFG29747.1 LysR family transcriptional regulator [Pseudomonas umsongensis]
MDIRHFRYFLAVARHRNFTRAAEQLGIAPPTLTRQIQDMEAELGARLFLRQVRDVSLTEAGAALVIEAEATVRQFESAQRNAQRAGRGDIGHIELGYVASAVYSGLLQKQVQGFAGQYPDVSLNVRESPMASLPNMILEGRFDLGYIRCPLTLPEGVESVRLSDEGFVLALSVDSWLNRLPVINSAHLHNENFILPEQVVGTLQVAAQGAFVPKLGAQPGGLVAVIALVSLGQGVAVVPESVVGHVSLPNVVYRQINDCNASSWLALIHRRFEKSPAVVRYIERVKNR